MLGGTHKRIGIVASFAVLRPTTIPACLGALAAGAIGGDICDIDILFKNNPAKDEDQNRDDHYDGAWEDAASNVLLFLLFVLVDWYFGNGAVDWFHQHLGFHTLAAGAVLALIVVCGTLAPHRSYMHSILIGLIMSGCVFVICAPLAPAFAIGYATHIVLDLVNKGEMALLWPLKKGFSLKLCSANKTANAVLETIGEILCDLLVAYFLMVSLLNYNQSTKIIEFLTAPFSEGVTNLGAWLIVINIITFFAENINFSLWVKGKGPYQEHDENFNAEKDNATMFFMQRNMYILFVAGGALGGLLGYLAIALRGKKYIKNGALGLVIPLFGAVCVVLEWACIYLLIVNPGSIYDWLKTNAAGVNILYIGVYLLAMNIAAFIVYINDKKRLNSLKVKTVLELIIAFIGGATGAYLAINIEGYFSAQKPMKGTVMKMVQTHCVIIALVAVLFTSTLYR